MDGIRNIVILSIIFVILISGCVQEETRLTPPTTTPAKMPETSSAYGNVLAYQESGGMGTLTLSTEIVNCEINQTTLDVSMNLTVFKETTYACKQYLSYSPFEITDFNELEVGKWYAFIDEHNCGEIIEKETTSSVPPHGYIKVNQTYTYGSGGYPLFIQDNMFTLARVPYEFGDLVGRDIVWRVGYDFLISEDLEKYKQECASHHDKDLIRDQMTLSKEYESGAASIFYHIINTSEEAELQIKLINKQDNYIKYKIKDAKILNEEASQWYGHWWQLPPYEQRISDSEIDECVVSFDVSEKIIPADSEQILTFSVLCSDDMVLEKSYEICEWYDENRNCTNKIAKTDNFILWGEIEFTDELDNTHIFPDQGILKQHIMIE